MPRPISALFSLTALLLGAPGCVTTGQAWVQQPENSLLQAGSADLERVAAADLAALGVAQPAPTTLRAAADAPRPKLSHVVSLGESAGREAPPPGANTGPNPGTPPVVVNIVNYAAVPTYDSGYPASYPAYGSREPAQRPSRLRPSSASPSPVTPSIGQDWKAPASYGPLFPYRTGPASPWQRPR